MPALKRSRPAITLGVKLAAAAIERWQAVTKADMLQQADEQLTARRALFTGLLPTHAETHKADAVAPAVGGEALKLLRQATLDELRRKLTTEAGLTVLYGDIDKVLAAVTADGAIEALVQIGMNNAPSVMLDLVNEEAVQWASERAAEMVGMKLVNGKLVPNPNAQWVITDKQREDTADMVVRALEQGWSNDRLASELSDAAAFGPERAEMIARTETAQADVQGNMAAYRNSSLVTGKAWILGDEACAICETNAAQGVIGLNDVFLSGDDGPPAHPNCRCDVLPSLIDIDGSHDDDMGD